MTELVSEYASASYLITFVLSGIGTYKILKKCGLHGFWAFVPGLREFKLSEAAGCETDGFYALLLNVPVFVATYFVLPFFEAETREYMLISVFILAGFIAILIFETRIYLNLCRLFRVTRLWTVLWIFCEFLPALLWGFSKKFVPSGPDSRTDDDNLAGFVPADFNIYKPVIPEKDRDTLKQVLYVDVRKRTVRDFARRRYLLKDIGLLIPKGSLVLLLGGSGAGKTTLVNAVTGYEKADATILLGGNDVYKDYDKMKYRIGFVPQQDLMRSSDTVRHTLYDAGKMRLPLDVKRKEFKSKVKEVSETLGIASGQNDLVSKKSGGQKKRISIGMELVSDPELFILDEPDSGLDGVIARELFTKLREIASSGKIVIAITHTPDRVIDLFDKVIVLAKDSGRVGRLAFYGTPDEARSFFEADTMEDIIMKINRREEGGEGLADTYIARYYDWEKARGGDEE